jgi:hypothetical protein
VRRILVAHRLLRHSASDEARKRLPRKEQERWVLHQNAWHHRRVIPPSQHRHLTALGRTAALALLALALLHGVQLLIIWQAGGRVLWPLLAFLLVILLSAGLVAAGLRWAPVLGALVALLTSAIAVVQPREVSALLHPASGPGEFGLLVIMDGCALVAIVSGVAATIQNALPREPRTPRWLGTLLVGLSGLVVGMLLAAVLAAANPQSGPATSGANGMPTVHIAGGQFMSNVVLVPRGQKLQFVDDDGVEHIIQNGFWNSPETISTAPEPGAPRVHLDLKSGPAVIGPFPIEGVFHFYCTIHPEMNLTVVVQ